MPLWELQFSLVVSPAFCSSGIDGLAFLSVSIIKSDLIMSLKWKKWPIRKIKEIKSSFVFVALNFFPKN